MLSCVFDAFSCFINLCLSRSLFCLIKCSNGCFSRWYKNSRTSRVNCPGCREEVVFVKRNHTLQNIIEVHNSCKFAITMVYLYCLYISNNVNGGNLKCMVTMSFSPLKCMPLWLKGNSACSFGLFWRTYSLIFYRAKGSLQEHIYIYILLAKSALQFLKCFTLCYVVVSELSRAISLMEKAC